jgi:Protein of unknown function VcgC/VcgE (DUF2780)
MAVILARLCGLLVALMLAGAQPALAQMSATELVETLKTDLGVNERQASGGAGAVLKLAEERLGPSEFSMIEDSVPGADQLLEAAPALGEAPGALGGASSALGLSDLGGLAPLTGAFSLLGMSPEMIPQFAETVLGYVQSGGGEPVAGLLQRALLGG